MELTTQQKDFYKQFGYLHFPGMLNDSVEWIIQEFETVWAKCQSVKHTGEQRTMFPGNFICQTPKLCSLMDDPRIQGMCEGLMGPDYQCHRSGLADDFYSGDTGWHSDLMPNCGFYKHCEHIKIAFYLDPVTRDTGALRVIPGSHIPGDRFSDTMQEYLNKSGLAGKDVPAAALETKPGDVVLFTHNGETCVIPVEAGVNRMFVMNMQAYPHAPGAHAEVKAEWTYYASVGVKKMHSGLIMDTAFTSACPEHLQPLCGANNPGFWTNIIRRRMRKRCSPRNFWNAKDAELNRLCVLCLNFFPMNGEIASEMVGELP